MRIVAYFLLIAVLLAAATEYLVSGGRVRREIRARAAAIEDAARQTRDLLAIRSPPSREELGAVDEAATARHEKIDQAARTLARGGSTSVPSVDELLARAASVGLNEGLRRALADSLTSTASRTAPESRRRAVGAFLAACEGSKCRVETVTLDAADNRDKDRLPIERVRLRASLVGSPSALVQLFEKVHTPRLEPPSGGDSNRAPEVVGDVVNFHIAAIPPAEWESLGANAMEPPVRLALEIDFLTGAIGSAGASGGAP